MNDKMLEECRAHWEAAKPDAVFADYWEGWQASRESLVIELPDYFDPNGSGDRALWEDLVIEAIEAAGLKVKS